MTWNRRDVLRGLLGGAAVSVALPHLEYFSTKAQAANGFPQRWVTWMWGNGNIPDFWTPSATGSNWALSDQLSPLESVKDKLTLVTGLSTHVMNNVPHFSGAAGLLTGQPALGVQENWTVAAPTVDQILANAIGGSTIYRSLQMGIATTDAFSYNGENAPNPGEDNPFALYERLFGPTFREPGEGGLVDPRLGFRRSVLDAVMGDINKLNSRVGSADKQRLEQHFDAVRDLEGRLARLQEDPPDLAACSRPEEPPAEIPDIDGRPDLDTRNRLISELSAMALACDQTRVMHIQFSRAVTNTLYPGASDGHHNLTHNEGRPQNEVNDIVKQIIGHYGTFLEALDAIPEGDGTLLDNCLVFGCSDVSEGLTHSLDELPIIIGGSAGGAIRAGEHLRYLNRDNSNQLMLSLIRAFGVPQASFGADDTLVEDGLSEIEV